MSAIEFVVGREVLDSRGNPTVEVEVVLDSGARGRAIAPSGASTGATRRSSCATAAPATAVKGVLQAVANVNGELAEGICGLDALDQRAVDLAMVDLDGTPDKGRLGANAMVATSLAVAKAARVRAGRPPLPLVGGANAHVLPVPQFNVVNGGAHATNNVDFQEFMVMPVGAASYAEALRWGSETYHALRRILAGRSLSTGVGDEGGFAPDLAANEEAVRLLVEAIEAAGRVPGDEIAIALDPATSELWKDGAYELAGEGRTLSPAELVDYWVDLVDRYPIVSHRRRDGRGRLGRLGGADRRLGRPGAAGRRRHLRHQRRAASSGGSTPSVANAVLIKVNQIGTLTETLDTIALATRSAYRCGDLAPLG